MAEKRKIDNLFEGNTIIVRRRWTVLILEEEIGRFGGEIKRFKDYVFKAVFPQNVSRADLEKTIFVAQEQYGANNLVIYIDMTEIRHEVLFFRTDRILEEVAKLVTPFGLHAEILDDVFTVGGGGDNRSYTPVVVLVGPNPGWEVLKELSGQISNTLPINRVTYETVGC